MDEFKKAVELREGVSVLIVLAVLTALEFWIGAATGWTMLLITIALVKAAIVIQYFMHLPRLFSAEGGDH
ncbi:MAG: cytochrome C oxidase subunit IV family protein [Ardenticatenaceae bacterium]|nr:cytochrome C oxidase subunit IV family protein [Ardenticatenaceae bacterium]